jgi:Mg-chelatase subunit ChlD
MSAFETNVYQNEYLPAGGTEVDALVRVDSAGVVEGAPVATTAAEIIIIDCSGSMNHPRSRIEEAKAATVAAVECIRDGVEFAVVAGSGNAEPVFPREGGLAVATPDTRAAARKAINRVRASGGTAMGRWLTYARHLFAGSSAELRHAILLTDGMNEGESPDQLGAALEDCADEFQCDCRGVGADWEVGELRRIATALLGTVDLVREPEGLREEFTAMMTQAMGKGVAAVELRVWTPRDAEVVFVKQVAPAIEDLTDRRTTVSDQVGGYPTGSWGEETRDYHVRIRVPAREVGDKMLAGRVSLVVGDDVQSEAKVLCVWTADEAMSTRIDPEVAHATGQTDMADAIGKGLEALARGDHGGATTHIGRAVKLAAKSGDTQRLHQLERIAEIDDAATGTVRIRTDAARIDVIELDAASTKTTRRPQPDPSGAAP